MCGLAGFARHKNAPDLSVTQLIFEDLMSSIASRGRHATGVAVGQGKKSFIWKKAAPVDLVLKSDAWKTVMGKIEDDVTVIMGHVRFATHNNAHLDEAAHPFIEGKIIGAHNGIIRNWQEIAKEMKRTDWINDSQAPFALLDKYKNPVKALDEMDGYWALTWTKGDSLFFTRTNDAPLAVAYVPEMKTLFWCSEYNKLNRILRDAKVGDFDIWEAAPNTIYRYAPDSFDKKSAHAEKVNAPFRGRNMKQNDKFNSARPSLSGTSTTSATITQADGQIVVPFSGGQRGWNATRGEEVEINDPRSKNNGATYTLKELDKKFSDILADVFREVDDLKGQVEVANAEIEFLRKICDDAGLLDVVKTSDVDDDESVEPYDEPCSACGNDFIEGETMNPDGQNGYVHDRCLLTDAHVSGTSAN